MTTATFRKSKCALLRRPGYPIGTPAPLYLECPCGKEVDVPEDGEIRCSTCSRRFDRAGWIQVPPTTAHAVRSVF
jgi:hypothetical protein